MVRLFINESLYFRKYTGVMEWPAKSHDFKPIENIWGILARAVYRNGRQFETKDLLEPLKIAIVSYLQIKIYILFDFFNTVFDW
jgi:hypothetical protein